MLITTNAIVFRRINYSESSIILNLFTEKKGLQSYIHRGGRKSKKNNVSRLFQPLAMLEIVAYYNDKSGLKTLKEAKLLHPYQNIYNDAYKRCIMMFINEVLLKSVKEEEANKPLYNFLSESFKLLDALEADTVNFHLIFLMKLSYYLGFKANIDRNAKESYFDLREGIYILFQPDHNDYLDLHLANLWQQIQKLDWQSIEEIKITNGQRRQLLNALLLFYKLHVDHFGELKSLEVLKEILV